MICWSHWRMPTWDWRSEQHMWGHQPAQMTNCWLQRKPRQWWPCVMTTLMTTNISLLLWSLWYLYNTTKASLLIPGWQISHFSHQFQTLRSYMGSRKATSKYRWEDLGGRKTAYALMGLGLHRRDYMDPGPCLSWPNHGICPTSTPPRCWRYNHRVGRLQSLITIKQNRPTGIPLQDSWNKS